MPRAMMMKLRCAASLLRRRKIAALALAFVLTLNVHVSAVASESFTVTLADGAMRTPCYATPSTVEEFLTRLDKMPRELDELDLPLDHQLQAGDVITITRREYVTHKEIKPIPFRTVYVHSPELSPGEETVTAEGSNGRSELVYSRYLVNGQIVEETLIGENIITKAVDRQISIGFRSVPVSKMDFDAVFDENGEPLEYKSVLRGQRSAGYSAKPGAGTASGIAKAGVGYVAVNPKVIPYGSKLFIQSADGKFIYGYAIAADTGTALMDGRIALDCFYASYQESADHGIRKVDIFVLE